MGMSISTLKLAAPAAWAVNVVAQIYGMSSSPNMLDRHNENLSYFSPNPYMIPAFFTPQQLVQVAWLYRLATLSSRAPSDRAELDIQADYAPYHTLGNVCIAAWMLFWNSNDMVGSDVMVWVNSVAQLGYLAGAWGGLDRMNTRSRSSVLTHLNAKTFAGIGVLDLLHNTSAAFAKGAQPSTLVKVLTGLGFGAASACSDWIFGGCLVYDLVALSIGQRDYSPDWSRLLAAYAVGSAAIVGLKNWFRPPYVSGPTDYEAAAIDEIADRV